MTLLAVPNVSTADPRTVEALAGAFGGSGARLLDVHTDPDHARSVFTLSGDPAPLLDGLLAGVARALELVDLSVHHGLHPHVGAVDVAPIVYPEPADRGRACATALVLADRLGQEARLPVLLYGELAGGRTRAELRRGGARALATRIADGELVPDFGPARVSPRAGVTLVAARPPLVAFNVELAAPADRGTARAIAAAIRESGPEGLAGVRAIGLWLGERGVAQVSTNLDDPGVTRPADVVAAIRRHADVTACELVGLAPRSAFDGFPIDEVPVRGLRLIEDLRD